MFRTTRHAARTMRGNGRIINAAGGNGRTPVRARAQDAADEGDGHEHAQWTPAGAATPSRRPGAEIIFVRRGGHAIRPAGRQWAFRTAGAAGQPGPLAAAAGPARPGYGSRYSALEAERTALTVMVRYFLAQVWTLYQT